MITTITLAVPEEVAEQLVNCEVGEDKTLTFTVTEKTESGLRGDVKSVEGYSDDDEGHGDDNDEAATDKPEKPDMHKVPKAVIMVGVPRGA